MARKRREAPAADAPDVVRFGFLVYSRRTARRWSQEALASAAFDNATRKGFVSQIENGRIGDITHGTVASVCRALEIVIDDVPESLRPPEAAAEVHREEGRSAATERRVEEMTIRLEEQAASFGVQRGMLIELAHNYARVETTDFETALRGVREALRTAHDMEADSGLSSNLSDAVSEVLREVDRRNREESLAAGTSFLDLRIERLRADKRNRIAEFEQEEVRLHRRGVAQARLTNRPEDAARHLIAEFEIEAPADPEAWFQAMRKLWEDQYVEGRDRGLAFDLEVSIAISQAVRDGADTPNRRGAALNDLAVALGTLGMRESGTARLEEAVAALRSALEEWTRERGPLAWARCQMNLGNALKTLGARESGTARLEEAVAAYRSALEEWTRELVPLDWAGCQMNLGTALRTLGARESGTARLEEAVAALRSALEEWTREREPLEWAMCQMNLGNALADLGARESGTACLQEAVSAYRAALEEVTQERVPYNWAVMQENLAHLHKDWASKLDNPEEVAAHLSRALGHLEGVLEVYREAGATYRIEQAESLRADILAAMEGGER